MIRTLVFLLTVLVVPLSIGCDPSSTLSPGPPLDSVVFYKVLERDVSDVTGFPSGLAISPDGRWLVSLGFSRHNVSVYDAATLTPISGPLHYVRSMNGDSVQLVHPHAVVISPDGSIAVVTSRTGVLGLSLPSLGLVFGAGHSPRDTPRQVVRDHSGENYYVAGENFDVARLTANGEREALFEADGVEGIALTRDEAELLVLVNYGMRLVALRTPDLSPGMSIDLPFEGEVVVPLKIGNRVIVVGGASGGPDTAARTPLMALSVDVATGSIGSLQVLCCERPGGLIFLFGDGNQWADVGEATAIVPTAIGTVTIDTNLGVVTLHSAADLGKNLPPCCDIASYPTRDRVAIANFESGVPGGSLIVYDIEERMVFNSN